VWFTQKIEGGYMYQKVLEKMIKYFGNDVKRINHALKVWVFSHIIAKKESLDVSSENVVNFTAILHDIGIKEAERKYNSNSAEYQEKEGPPIAENMLKELGIDDSIIKRVCFIIGNHHTYNMIDGIDFQIIVEADFLVNIYEDEMKKETIDKIKNNFFKTKTGLELISSLYRK